MINKWKIVILNKLLDKYDRRYSDFSDFRQRVSLKFNQKEFNEYVSESSFEYVEYIDEAVIKLKEQDIINVKYEKVTKRVQIIYLNLDHVDVAYEMCDRRNIRHIYGDVIDILVKSNLEVADKFKKKLEIMSQEKKSYLSYIMPLEDLKETLKGIDYIRKMTYDDSIRNISVRVFNDSKRLETLIPRIVKLYNLIYEEENTVDEFMINFGINKNPTQVLLKGTAVIKINNQIIDLNEILSPVSLQSDFIEDFMVIENKDNKVLTIENKTSFYNSKEKGLIIYLGGFSNHSKVKLLRRINSQHDSEFLHFGDIDYGGFLILNHLINETGINIKAVNMNIETLMKYNKFGKSFNESYKKKLFKLLELKNLMEHKEVIRYMITNEIILEQEAVKE